MKARCQHRWCWRRYSRIAHVYAQVGDHTIRFGAWFCHRHADQADQRARELRGGLRFQTGGAGSGDRPPTPLRRE